MLRGIRASGMKVPSLSIFFVAGTMMISRLSMMLGEFLDIAAPLVRRRLPAASGVVLTTATLRNALMEAGSLSRDGWESARF